MPKVIDRIWPGSTVVCIAPGPSLVVEDANAVRGKAHVIAVGTAYRMAPWADVLYHADAIFWRENAGVPEFEGLKCGMEPDSKRWGVTVLKKTGREGLESEPTGLKTGQNSGYQAIGVAVHLGAARILLLGYDMQRGPNGEEHCAGGDHKHAPHSNFPRSARNFPTLVAPLRARGITIVNCSRATALTCFPRMPLMKALAEYCEAAA